MRVVIAHNFYGDYAASGENQVALAEEELLKSYGHDVFFYKKTNYDLLKMPLWKILRAPFEFSFSKETYREAVALFRKFRPDILHVHNYKYLITPSIFQAAKDCGVKTVLTLHNYRLICPCAMLYSNGTICERCINGNSAQVLWRHCMPYSHSWGQRLLQYYFFNATSRKVRTGNLVDAFIALTPFSAELFKKSGIPQEKIFVKPNFIKVPRVDFPHPKEQYGAVFVGRLSPEKGVDFLIDVWKSIDYPLTVIGDGPLRKKLEKKSGENVEFVGNLSHQDVLELISKKSFLIFPSVWYEGFPMTILEAFSMRLPVVASDLGPRSDMIHDGENGFLFKSGDRLDFINKVRALILNPVDCYRMGESAYGFFLKCYSSKINYDMLMNIYRSI